MHAAARRIAALARRGDVIEVKTDSDMELYYSGGWTPARSALDRALADWGMGIAIGEFSLGQYRKRKLDISGVGTDTVTIMAEQEFRLGKSANALGAKVTNRDAPWITGKWVLMLKGASMPTSSDLMAAPSPVFPSYKLYLGTGTNAMNQTNTQSPGESQIIFIDRGAKFIKRGV